MGKVKKTPEWRDRIQEIKERATQSGVEQNVFFLSTLERYECQIKIIDELQKNIDEAIEGEGVTISKEYVKGRENVVINPIFPEHSRQTAAANKTVETLIRIIKSFATAKDEHPDDPLMEILNGTVE
jgi:hypothetical protein